MHHPAKTVPYAISQRGTKVSLTSRGVDVEIGSLLIDVHNMKRRMALNFLTIDITITNTNIRTILVQVRGPDPRSPAFQNPVMTEPSEAHTFSSAVSDRGPQDLTLCLNNICWDMCLRVCAINWLGDLR